MNAFVWIIAGVAAAGGLGLFLISFSDWYLEARATVFAFDVGLKLPTPLRPTVQAQIARRHRGVGLGVLAGIVLGALVALVSPNVDDAYMAIFAIGGFALAGAVVGVAVTSAIVTARRDPQAVSIARAGAVRLQDYVSPVERTVARGVVVLNVPLFVLAVLFGTGVGIVLAGILMVLGVAALVFFEIVGRRIVDRAQPAASPLELAWDDALRGSLLRDMVVAPLGLGFYGLLVAVILIIGQPGQNLVSSLAFLFVIGSAALRRTKPGQYYLRRLWKNTAPAVET